jgi:hypothetical protein
MSACPSTFWMIWIGTPAFESRVPVVCRSLWMLMSFDRRDPEGEAALRALRHRARGVADLEAAAPVLLIVADDDAGRLEGGPDPLVHVQVAAVHPAVPAPAGVSQGGRPAVGRRRRAPLNAGAPRGASHRLALRAPAGARARRSMNGRIRVLAAGRDTIGDGLPRPPRGGAPVRRWARGERVG